jgi:hypothetical protein
VLTRPGLEVNKTRSRQRRRAITSGASGSANAAVAIKHFLSGSRPFATSAARRSSRRFSSSRRATYPLRMTARSSPDEPPRRLGTSQIGSLGSCVGIPAKLNAHSGRNPNGIPRCTRTPSERSDAGISIVQEVFGFVKRNLSGAKRRKNTASSERGAGKGAAALVPASAHSNPERDQRSVIVF